jgi:hypothetical protein
MVFSPGIDTFGRAVSPRPPGATGDERGGLVRASRRLARYKPVVEVAPRPTPLEPNIKITASRRDAREIVSCFLASLRDAFLFVIITGGVVRKASLNHRLISCKPPACPGGPGETALPKTGLRVTSVNNERKL